MTMLDPLDVREKQIIVLQAALRLPLPEEARRQLQSLLNTLQATTISTGDTVVGDKIGGDKIGGDKIVHPQATINLNNDAHVSGVVVGINLGTIIYGSPPTDAQREQLTRYLNRVAAKLQRLPIGGLSAHFDEGPGVQLSKVYVMLATMSASPFRDGLLHQLTDWFVGQNLSQSLVDRFNPMYALPHEAVVHTSWWPTDPALLSATQVHTLYRALLATEAVHTHQRLVLLGDPGGGKSTFLRHLAWAMARRGLDELNDATALLGWDAQTRLLPVLLPLRALAGRIAVAGAGPAIVSMALRDEMTREYDTLQADILLDQALHHGAILLLFDGLDEVPLEAIPGVSADRLTTLRAVRAFTEIHNRARAVMTCRTRAFDANSEAYLGWPIEIIAPFTLGQIRYFSAEWYAALIERGAIARHLGDTQLAILVNAIRHDARLQSIAATPLLLTIMALVLAERGELPRDRAVLYEQILEQLFGQWDQHKGGLSLAETLGVARLRSDDLRPIFDELSYKAHAGATASDGRGRLGSKDLRYALAEFLERVKVAGAWEAAGRCLTYFNERSGLLLPEDDGATYAFAHLTLQEHSAGRYILLHPQAVELVMRHRGDDRWREPIALGLGVVHKVYPPLADRIDRILTELIDPDEHGAQKSLVRWYRDLVLAAEIGFERDWNMLRMLINVNRIQRELRRGLVTLLGDTTQPLPIAERVRAGLLLGDLCDPRFPTTVEDWRQAVTEAHAGRRDSYFCPIPQQQDGQNLWIARYPITNDQWQQWMPLAQLPPRSHGADANFNRPNQPAVGVTWALATAFCAWLSQQINATIRLPSEAEWEAAARGRDGRRYPWGNTRLRDRAATKEDHDLRAWPYTTPVGCYPAGASPVGALDMAGNVWEWTSDIWHSDDASAHHDGKRRALRGGGYLSKKNQTLTTARIGLAPGTGFDNGLRVILELGKQASRD